MDAALAAAMSDPAANPLFHRRWTGPPPQKRERPRRQPGAHVSIDLGKCSKKKDSVPVQAAQRACVAARRRLADLQRRAALCQAIGLTDAAGRLLTVAATIREALAP
jgi:hypothetical protein